MNSLFGSCSAQFILPLLEVIPSDEKAWNARWQELYFLEQGIDEWRQGRTAGHHDYYSKE
jgi:hypothetical protein